MMFLAILGSYDINGCSVLYSKRYLITAVLVGQVALRWPCHIFDP
jgi:hypothetical protein